jgi:hypothetical protein
MVGLEEVFCEDVRDGRNFEGPVEHITGLEVREKMNPGLSGLLACACSHINELLRVVIVEDIISPIQCCSSSVMFK